jgi:hypothetical protein
MSIEFQLREKLRKIETLFAGASTAGERLAAEQHWSAFAPAWRSLGDGIRQSRCNSRCRIVGRGIYFSRFAGAMDWRRIVIIASDATR